MINSSELLFVRMNTNLICEFPKLQVMPSEFLLRNIVILKT